MNFSVCINFRFQFLSEKEMLMLGKCLNNIRVVMEEKNLEAVLGFCN